MVCIAISHCEHSRSADLFIELFLMIIAIIIGIRILAFLIERSIWRWRRQNMAGMDDLIIQLHEMRTLARLHEHQQQQSRSSPNEWQSKLVINAGDDHVSCIANPCPFNSK